MHKRLVGLYRHLMWTTCALGLACGSGGSSQAEYAGTANGSETGGSGTPGGSTTTTPPGSSSGGSPSASSPVPDAAGLGVAVYRLGSNPWGDDPHLWLGSALAYTGAHAPDYIFVDAQAARSPYLGFAGRDDGTLAQVLGPHAGGAAASDTKPLGTIVLDFFGAAYFPRAGTYTLAIDGVAGAAAIYLDGARGGVPGDGNLVALAPQAGSVGTQGTLTVAAPGWRNIEIFFAHASSASPSTAQLAVALQGPQNVILRTQAAPPVAPTAVPGLTLSLWQKGNDQSLGDSPAAYLNFAASTPPTSTTLDTSLANGIDFSGSGGDTSGLVSFFGSQLTGPISLSNLPLETTVADFQGEIFFSVVGDYTFSLTGHDGYIAVYLDGSGPVGSGNLLIDAEGATSNLVATVSVAEAGWRPVEIFWYNEALANHAGGADIGVTVAGPAPIKTRSLPWTPPPADIVIADSATLPQVLLGPPSRVFPPTFADSTAEASLGSSTFPVFPNATDAALVALWPTNGQSFRSEGPALTAMAAPSPTGAVLAAGASGTFDQSGVALTDVVRQADGQLVAHYRGVNDTFADGQSGQWVSSGIATSTDDGATWSGAGQIIGLPQPSTHQVGGRALGCMIQSPLDHSFLGIGDSVGFRSTDANAAAGTWLGWDGSAFTQAEPDLAGTGQLQPLNGLSGAMASCQLTFNTFTGTFLLIFQEVGPSAPILAATSTNFTSWGPPQTLLTPSSGLSFSSPFLLGSAPGTSDRDAALVYMQSPPVGGLNLDMVVRTLHLGP